MTEILVVFVFSVETKIRELFFAYVGRTQAEEKVLFHFSYLDFPRQYWTRTSNLKSNNKPAQTTPHLFHIRR